MRLHLVPALALLAPSVGQDPGGLVDGMIERSNGLKSFVATYRMHLRSKDAGDVDGGLRLVYRAPESLSMEVDFEEGGVRTVIADGKMSFDRRKDGRSVQQGESGGDGSPSKAQLRIARIFHEQFPSLGDVVGSQGPEVFVRLQFKAGTESERPEFSLQAGTGRGEGALLNWLDQVKRSKMPPVPEGDALVWEPAEGIRVFMGKETGFIEKVVATYRGETRMALELTDLALDVDVEDSDFRLSEIDSSTEDISESLGRDWEITRIMTMRGLMHRRVRNAVEAGTMEWTSDLRARLEVALRALHQELSPLVSEQAVRWAVSTVDKFCSWYQEANRSIPEGDVARADELEDKRIEWDARFRESLEKSIEPYLARAVPDVADASASTFAREVRALELESAELACRRSVVEPALERFVQQLELARQGALPREKN